MGGTVLRVRPVGGEKHGCHLWHPGAASDAEVIDHALATLSNNWARCAAGAAIGSWRCTREALLSWK